MLINPKRIIKEGIIQNHTEEAIQPNSIDLTLKSIRRVIDGGSLKKNSKNICHSTDIEPERDDCYRLEANAAFDVVFNEHVKIPEGMAAFITHRSTLNRIGGFITSGIYDSGFNNYVGAILRTNAIVNLERGARIATIYFIKADNAHLYAGQYQGK